jgi:hypothetical protein
MENKNAFFFHILKICILACKFQDAGLGLGLVYQPALLTAYHCLKTKQTEIIGAVVQ